MAKAQRQILDPTSLNQQNTQIVGQVLGNSSNQDFTGVSQGVVQNHPTSQANYNNKIIINQQHYFTDSIKIYPEAAGGRRTSMHEFIQNGINGLNMGAAGFTATHFTDLINQN